MRAQLSQLKQVIGMFIKSTTNGPTSKVYSFGSNINKLRAALGGGTLRNHNSFGPLVVLVGTSSGTTLRRHAIQGPDLSENLFSRVSTIYRHRFGVERTKTLQEIIPDLLIDGRFLSIQFDGAGASLFRGTRTLVDVKTKSCERQVPSRVPWVGVRS